MSAAEFDPLMDLDPPPVQFCDKCLNAVFNNQRVVMARELRNQVAPKSESKTRAKKAAKTERKKTVAKARSKTPKVAPKVGKVKKAAAPKAPKAPKAPPKAPRKKKAPAKKGADVLVRTNFPPAEPAGTLASKVVGEAPYDIEASLEEMASGILDLATVTFEDGEVVDYEPTRSRSPSPDIPLPE